MGSACVGAQFLRLGNDGYRRIMINLQAVAKRMTLALEATGHFKIVSHAQLGPCPAWH